MKKKEKLSTSWLRFLLYHNLGVIILLLASITISGCTEQKSVQESVQESAKPRVVITLDPECDDLNSLVRFLLFSTDYKVEGIVYTSSQWHWKGDGKLTMFDHRGREWNTYFGWGPQVTWRWKNGERFIHDAVDIYEQVYPNLKVHNPDYPTPEYLRSKIRWGNIEFEGEMAKDTEGSDLIKSLMLDDVPGTLFVTAWGGQNTIARALKSIEEEYSGTPEWGRIKEKVSEKVMILPSGEQDDTYQNYTKLNWPDIGYSSLGGANIPLGYGAQGSVSSKDSIYYTAEWMQKNISSVGPFGPFYRVWGDGKQMYPGDKFDVFGFSGYTFEELADMGYVNSTPIQPKGSFLAEGDTHTFLNLIDNGLRAWEDENYGGWSGRKRLGNIVRSGPLDLEAIMSNPDGFASFFRRRNTPNDFPDFVPAVQNGLASRFQWSVTPSYEGANHDPVIDGTSDISAKPGEKVDLRAEVSDPDGNDVSVRWMQFKVNSYEGEVKADNPTLPSTSVVVPEDAQPGQTIHMVLEAVDNGTPSLTRYKRVIITVI